MYICDIHGKLDSEWCDICGKIIKCDCSTFYYDYFYRTYGEKTAKGVDITIKYCANCEKFIGVEQS